ncbi:MAG: alpha/beta fold hydrolase [Pseudomonadota bacterium]
MPEPTETIPAPCAVGPGAIPCHLFEPDQAPHAVALVVHGRNGAMHQPHIQALIQAYLTRGWRVMAPDLPHSAATPASGPSEDVTMDGHARAAGDVLTAILRDHSEGLPLGLCGHSLGAHAIAAIAGDVPELHHLLAVSPVVSGLALLDARAAMGPPALEALAREAPRMRETMASESAVPFLERLEAPVAVMTGALDGLTPPAAARAYFDAAPRACFYAVLKGQHHCPTGPELDRALASSFDAVDS